MLLRNHFFLTSSPALMKSYSMLKPRAVSPLPLNRSVRCGPDDTSTGGRNTLPLNTARRVLFVSWICEEEEREKAADWRWKRIQGWGETGTRTDRQKNRRETGRDSTNIQTNTHASTRPSQQTADGASQVGQTHLDEAPGRELEVQEGDLDPGQGVVGHKFIFHPVVLRVQLGEEGRPDVTHCLVDLACDAVLVPCG